MPYQDSVYLNIPVRDLEKSIKFYTAIGFTQNKTFSTPEGAMMSWTRNNEATTISYMLLTHPFYQTFLPPGIERVDPTRAAQIITCLSSSGREELDSTVEKAKAQGAKVDIREKTEIEKQMAASMGMYSRM